MIPTWKIVSLVTAGVVAIAIGVAFDPRITTVLPVASTSAPGGGVEAITPTRILDSRTTNGGHNAPFATGETFTLQVAGRGAVPMTGAAAIFGNVTVVPGPANGYVTLFPAGFSRPLASNVNYNPNTVIANQFLVALGAGGAISVYAYSAGIHIIIDVQGWVAEPELAAAGPSIAFNTTALTASDSVKAAAILASANRYAMTTWWDGPAQTLLAADLGAGDPGRPGNGDAVRRLSMEALSLSTALTTGAYNPVTVGVSAEVALARTAQLVDAVASWHVKNHVGGWGEHWQSPMWAGIVGRAAWFLWPQLPAQTQGHVARMVEHEANYAVRKPIHYLRNAAGVVLTPGDSGSEEVSWWTNAMQVALVLLPSHRHVRIWETEMVRFSLAAWARPADVTRSNVVNGRALSAWLAGSNVEANGVVINHSRVASDYSTTVYQNVDAVPLFAFAGRQTPQAIRELLGPVYAAFTGVTFTGAPYAAPGGTTYVSASGDIYYPQGNDWGTGQRLPYALADAQALTYGYDPGSAASFLALHLDAQLALQARFSDGRTYDNDVEYNYVGREEHVAQLASQLYLTLYVRDHDLVLFTNDSV